MHSLAAELAQEVRNIDWSNYECACSPATKVPEMWDRFMIEGDPAWEFGNELCHQGTTYSATFPLASPLLKLAKSHHPSRTAALTILAAVLRSTCGVLNYQRRLSKYLSEGPVANPFRPSERIKGPPLPNEEDVAREAESIRKLRVLIESELPCWLELAESADPDTRYAALELLGGVTFHRERELAERAIRHAYESGNEEAQRRLAWLIQELAGRNESD